MLQIACKLTAVPGVTSAGQQDQQQTQGSGDDLHVQDPSGGRQGTINSCHDHARQEKDLKREIVRNSQARDQIELLKYKPQMIATQLRATAF